MKSNAQPMKSAAAAAVAAACLALAHVPAVAGGWPVFDGANFSQTTLSAIENVAQTLKQIKQYQTQLQQYQNMIQNTAAPAAYVWDMASRTMSDLRGAIDTLEYYKRQLGSTDRYLSKFKDVSTYRSSPCFSGHGCTPEQWLALRESQDIASQAQKRSIDAMMRAIDHQQQAMEADARQLKLLQAGAQGVNGQVQAIGYANQLASQQANQLLQMRALLVAQQNMMAAHFQSIADRESQARAADQVVTRNIYRPSPPRTW
jgi:type IV secretion system protein TrbJ